MSLTPEAARIELRLRLVRGPGISQPQLERLQRSWEPGVERIWSDRFALVVDGTTRPIRLDVQFSHRNPHFTVAVKDDPTAGADQLHWSRFAGPNVVAHEVGHMLGAYDDYPGGAQNPNAPTLDGSSIMSGNPSGRCHARHFELVENWAVTRLGDVEIAHRSGAEIRD